MLTELDRSMSQLQLQGFAKPFFIQYRIEEIDDFETKAEFGSSEGSNRAHQRVARVTVRVGDYKTDSSGGRGDGSLELAALDNDPVALRSSLWTATDQAYKSRSRSLRAKAGGVQSRCKRRRRPTTSARKSPSSRSPIPSRSASTRMPGPIASPAPAAFTAPTRPVSAGQRDIEYSTASFRARATTTWLVTSEGTIVRKSSAEYQESFAAGTQAARRHAPRPLLRLSRSFARRPRLRGRLQQARRR